MNIAIAAPQSGTKVKWHIDPKHSEINFSTYQSVFTKIKGHFKGFGGTIQIEDDVVSGLDFNLWINPASITTGNDLRDEYLKGENSFDTDKYKIITYNSITLKKANREFLYESQGLLTIKNVTRVVRFEVDFIGEMTDPSGRQRLGFYIKGNLNRKNWNLYSKNQFDIVKDILINNDILIDGKLQFVKEF